MILFDGVHLASDNSWEELHVFAKKIGLKRSWFQEKKTHQHYDIISDRISALAIKLGAVKLDAIEMMSRMFISGMWTPTFQTVEWWKTYAKLNNYEVKYDGGPKR